MNEKMFIFDEFMSQSFCGFVFFYDYYDDFMIARRLHERKIV